jgi:phenylacetate-coenzyme A ligase PaaK-like adenylate-forming protein
MNFSTDKIFAIASEKDFSEAALSIFNYQVEHCEVYRQFVELSGIQKDNIKDIEDIPFLPVEFFKTHTIISNEKKPEIMFQSSGTTGTQPSKHFVADVKLYVQSFEKCFELFYGNLEDYCILALLPSYLERGNSSLVFMVDHLISKSRYAESSFYLDDYGKLSATLEALASEKRKTILLGVSYALLDFSERYSFPLQNCIVMETGGMKGRREEITRQELHEQLCQAFHVSAIHSEYGMTELLSQAYSNGNGIFKTPPWMKIMFSNPEDPGKVSSSNNRGIINVIDLANVYSCSFIATQDLGRRILADSFEVTGRTDYSDLRGCNLMVSDL